MQQSANVFTTMLAVRHVLDKAERSDDARPTLVLEGTDPNVFGTANLRRAARITLEFHSGSDRPYVGSAIRYAKRWMRRGLRWYMKPIVEQQMSFNNRLVDVVEQFAVKQESLIRELEDLHSALSEQQAVLDQAGTATAAAGFRPPPPDREHE
jgi:hypothetical protein